MTFTTQAEDQCFWQDNFIVALCLAFHRWLEVELLSQHQGHFKDRAKVDPKRSTCWPWGTSWSTCWPWGSPAARRWRPPGCPSRAPEQILMSWALTSNLFALFLNYQAFKLTTAAEHLTTFLAFPSWSILQRPAHSPSFMLESTLIRGIPCSCKCNWSIGIQLLKAGTKPRQSYTRNYVETRNFL